MVYTEILDSDKSALQRGSAAILTKIIISPNTSDEIVLTEHDAIKTWKYTDDRYVPDTNTFIGEFIARELSGELQNITDDFNIENKTIELQMGIITFVEKDTQLINDDDDVLITEDGEDELMRDASRINLKNYTIVDENWYSLGTFTVLEPDDNEVSDNTKFDAMDMTLLFNRTFNADYVSTNFPTSLNQSIADEDFFTYAELALYACEQVGIELATTVFPHSTDHVTTNQFTGGDSCRDVMKSISKSAFGWCRIGWDDRCYIDSVSLDYENFDEYYTIDNNQYYSLDTKKNIFGPVNQVLVGMEDVEGQDATVADSESIQEYGLTSINIYDNPLTYTQSLRDAAIIGADDALFGMVYTPMEIETIGHPWFKAYKPILIVDMEGNNRITYPFSMTLNYSGHIKTTFSAPSLTEAQQRLSYNNDIYKTIRNLQIIVDRAEGLISLLNSKVENVEGTTSSIETLVLQTISDTYSKTEIQKIVNGQGTDGVVVSSVTSTSGTFDEDGLLIEKTNAKSKGRFNETGVTVLDATGSVDEELLFAGYDSNLNESIVRTKNINVTKYLSIGTKSRIEDYEDGTGIFYIG